MQLFHPLYPQLVFNFVVCAKLVKPNQFQFSTQRASPFRRHAPLLKLFLVSTTSKIIPGLNLNWTWISLRFTVTFTRFDGGSGWRFCALTCVPFFGGSRNNFIDFILEPWLWPRLLRESGKRNVESETESDCDCENAWADYCTLTKAEGVHMGCE